MHIVIIGGSGHVGTYLVPRLVRAGHSVTNVSRGERRAYQPDAAWDAVQQITLDRNGAGGQQAFAAAIRDLQPDAVIVMIGYDVASCRPLVETLRGRVQHFLHCGTIWVHGYGVETPTTEAAARRPFGDYGVKKAEIEAYLLREARQTCFPATILHPGHIVGIGWSPINPAGNLDNTVFETLARGDELPLPNLGLETLHHVHADDVAQAFQRALERWGQAVGESFHVVSPAALTLRGYAEVVASWFSQEAKLSFLPWPEWKATVSAGYAEQTWDHIARSPNASIDKARALLGYAPRYTSLQAVRESVDALIAAGTINVA